MDDEIDAVLLSTCARHRFDDEGMATRTSEEQKHVEDEVAMLLSEPGSSYSVLQGELFDDSGLVMLQRDKHIAYLKRGLQGLPGSWSSLDSSRTWIVYWIIHSLDLLDALHSPDMKDDFASIIEFLAKCQLATGGFGGGPQQSPHTAAAYAAILSLLIIATPEAYAAINRDTLHSWYCSVKQPSGGFSVQSDGEIDVRGTYTVLAICDLLNMLTGRIRDGAQAFLLGCQSHEGGFGGEAGNEAHGGYAFCAIAGLSILNSVHEADTKSLCRWLVRRQMSMEGGFQGRTNKLVDGCYTFWQGACFAIIPPIRGEAATSATRKPTATPSPSSAAGAPSPLVSSFSAFGLHSDAHAGLPHSSSSRPGDLTDDEVSACSDDILMDRLRLQQYVLQACQDPSGGLRDKPGKGRDYYHTCYCLSGLSIAQHDRVGRGYHGWVYGHPTNRIEATHPVFNIRWDRVAAAREYFSKLPAPE